MNVCRQCQSVVAENALSMSLDGNGMICQACAISQQAVQSKAGMRKAYISGAFVVGLVLLYVAARIFVAINR